MASTPIDKQSSLLSNLHKESNTPHCTTEEKVPFNNSTLRGKLRSPFSLLTQDTQRHKHFAPSSSISNAKGDETEYDDIEEKAPLNHDIGAMNNSQSNDRFEVMDPRIHQVLDEYKVVTHDTNKDLLASFHPKTREIMNKYQNVFQEMTGIMQKLALQRTVATDVFRPVHLVCPKLNYRLLTDDNEMNMTIIARNDTYDYVELKMIDTDDVELSEMRVYMTKQQLFEHCTTYFHCTQALDNNDTIKVQTERKMNNEYHKVEAHDAMISDLNALEEIEDIKDFLYSFDPRNKEIMKQYQKYLGEMIETMQQLVVGRTVATDIFRPVHLVCPKLNYRISTDDNEMNMTVISRNEEYDYIELKMIDTADVELSEMSVYMTKQQLFEHCTTYFHFADMNDADVEYNTAKKQKQIKHDVLPKIPIQDVASLEDREETQDVKDNDNDDNIGNKWRTDKSVVISIVFVIITFPLFMIVMFFMIALLLLSLCFKRIQLSFLFPVVPI